MAILENLWSYASELQTVSLRVLTTWNNTVHTTEGDRNFIIAFKLLERQTSLTSFLKAKVFASLKQKQSYCGGLLDFLKAKIITWAL